MSYIIIDPSGSDTKQEYARLAASLTTLPPEEAIAHLKAFLGTHPGCGEAHNDLGILLQKCGNRTLALAHFEKACRLEPGNPVFRRNLASFYASELGWIEDAIDMYIDILSSNRRDIDAMIALGRLGASLSGARALEGPGEWRQDRSAAAEGPAPPHSPPDPADLHRRGLERFSEGDQAAALDLIRQAVEAEPSDPLYQNDLGYLLVQSGDSRGALNAYERAAALDPDNPLFVKNLADLCFASGIDPDRGITLYLDLHRKNPRDVEVLVNLGHMAAALDRPAEARTFYGRALEIEPWNREARDGISALTPPRPAPSRRSLEELLKEARDSLAAGDGETARRALESATTDYPSSAVAWNDLGVLLSGAGELDGALAAHRKAAGLSPDDVTFRKNLADISLVATGSADEAIGIYLDLFRKHPRDVDVLVSLGRISALVGRPEEARSFYRRALEIEPWNREVREGLRDLS